MHQDSFVFEASQECNHDCLHCYNAWKKPVDYPMGTLDTAETLAMLGKMLDETGAWLVTLNGGEPLLRPDLDDIIAFLAKRGVSVDLISNGSLLDDAAVARLAGGWVSVFDLPIACSIAMPPCLFDTARYERLTFGSCAAGTERAYYTLDPLGNVRPCNHSPTILGNIRTTSFAAMAEGRVLREFAAARPDFCAGRSLEAECRACCGSVSAMDPFLQAYHAQATRR